MGDLRSQLEDLARLYDVELSYHDIQGEHFVASDEALLALLPQLGADLRTLDDVPAALAARQVQLAQRVLEPVFIAWDDDAPVITLKLAEGHDHEALRIQVSLESGERFELAQALTSIERIDHEQVQGTRYETLSVGLGRSVPHGYHKVQVELTHGDAVAVHRAMLIAAPTRAWLPPTRRDWGLFAPTYALRSQSDLGVGGLAELERLVDLTKELGGSVVGTLPLTATFLRELASPSPYGPVSRLFWNELYIDLERLPEVPACAEVQHRLHEEGFRAQIEALRDRTTADHVGAMKVLRSLLEPLAEVAFAPGSSTRQEMLRKLAACPHLDEYAKFRATIEARGDAFHAWPKALADGQFGAEDYDEAAWRYHAYVQIRMADQVSALADRAQQGGGGLYLDLPLGVHPDGYDAWRFKDQFMSACSAGAPPDDLFAGGQDWGFRPLMPHAIRESGYAYTIACLHKQFASAGALRVDHVMGLHRIFCIPHGMSGDKGVYVRYRAEELYAILTLESHRNQCFVIGEDLGTVPDEVREAMDRHGLLRMYVMQFALSSDPSRAIAVPPAQAVASINTHDTPTFAAFWQDEDIDTRVALEHCTPEAAQQERQARAPMRQAVIQHLRDQHVLGEPCDTADVLGGALNLAASSESRLLLVNLEDLWAETRAQNVPGTVDEHANWQNRCPHSLEKVLEVPGLYDTLREIDRRRGR